MWDMLIKRIISLIMVVTVNGVCTFSFSKRFQNYFEYFFFWSYFWILFHKATEITGHIPERLISFCFSSRLSTVFQYLSLLAQAVWFTLIDEENGDFEKIKLKSWWHIKFRTKNSIIKVFFFYILCSFY